jgi:PAS domain S-box-containing protein
VSCRSTIGSTMNLTPPLDDHVQAVLLTRLADAVVVADSTGTICFWNEAAERVFGWSAAEAIGASLDLIVPERQRSRHWEGYHRVMSTGDTKYGTDLLRVPSLHADGQRRSIAFTVTLLTDDDGAVAGIAAVVRDETERWKEEQELRRRLGDAG